MASSRIVSGQIQTETLPQIDISLHADRMVSALCAAFAILALTLTCVGLYGTLTTGVTQRTNEIGVRMALGARPADVIAMIMREGLTLTLAGGGLGIAAAFVLTRAAIKLLFGLTPADPLTLVTVALLMFATAAATCYLPAKRASCMDPMIALRED
jgi:ABC-type antimicrobial peptide transport system permease subunit